MTLMFGSLQPLMTLFSIAALLSRANVRSMAVTAPGAAIELVGETPKDSAASLKPVDLNVRFMYSSTTDGSDSFQFFSPFNSGSGCDWHVSTWVEGVHQQSCTPAASIHRGDGHPKLFKRNVGHPGVLILV